MRSGKKFILRLLPALVALVGILVAGCNGAPPTHTSTQPAAAPRAQQVLRAYLSDQDITSFDPGTANDQPSIQAVQMVYTGLVQLNDKLEVTPQLASALPQISPDGLTYTFTLRPGLKFSDGTPLTATDVVYSLDRALSPTVSHANGVDLTLTYLGLIKGAADRASGKIPTLINTSLRAINDRTVAITVSQQTAYFLAELSSSTAFIVERKIIDRWGADWTSHLSDNGGQGGAGPFKVKSWNHNSGITFIPNPNYYGPQPRLQEVDYLFYKTPDASYTAYQANQLEYSIIPPQNLALAKTRTNEYHQYSQLITDYLAFNYLYKPLDNVKIREALELAINKDMISATVWSDDRTPTCHIVPQGQPGYNSKLTCPDNTTTRGDPTKARELFDEGLAEEKLTLATFPQLTYTYDSGSIELAHEVTAIIQAWKQVLGIDVIPNVVEFNTLYDGMNATTCTKTDYTKCLNKGLAIWSAAWNAEYPDPRDWLTLQFDKGSANNSVNYGQNGSPNAIQQVAAQQTLESADADFRSDRVALYNQVEQQLVNDVAWMPMDQRTGHYLLKSYVYGIVDNALGQIPPNDWGNIYITID